MLDAVSKDRTPVTGRRYIGEEARWQAVRDRDESADGQFWFSVATTGIYCYPSCAARHPLRKNVAFHETRESAERAGFRPCKRCRPDLPPRRIRQAQAIERACRMIAQAEREPSLAQLAEAAGLSPHYFQRCFKKMLGITPKQYALTHRADRVRQTLAKNASVTDAVYEAGYGSSARFYERSAENLGMAPRAFARGGAGESIRWDIGTSWLGRVLVAATERGICAILLGDDDASLVSDLGERFPRAVLERAERGSDFSAWLADALALIEAPSREIALPLDLAGTAFQRQVWAALREIPAGQTTTYGTIAHKIGRPRAVRAVASACASNPVAIAIPCHRVVAGDGSLSGYRWGLERKQALLRRESPR